MFQRAEITMKGIILDTKIRSGLASAKFTCIKFGDGKYDGSEDLSIAEGLKSFRQSFGISSIAIIDNKTVRLRTVADNTGIAEGYYITELGVFAEDPDEGEILYSIALGIENKLDYQPSWEEYPGATSTFDNCVSVSNVESATIDVGTGAAASAMDLEELRERIEHPEFDDSGEVEGIGSFPDFLSAVVSRMNIFKFFRDFKAGMQFVLHAGQLVNNGLCKEPGKFALDAAFGSNLQEQITQLNSEIRQLIIPPKFGDENILNLLDTTQTYIIQTSGMHFFVTGGMSSSHPRFKIFINNLEVFGAELTQGGSVETCMYAKKGDIIKGTQELANTAFLTIREPIYD